MEIPELFGFAWGDTLSTMDWCIGQALYHIFVYVNHKQLW